MMEFDVQVAHSVSEVGQEAWDRLSGDRPFTSYRWYAFGETILKNNTPIYIILLRAGEPVARGTFWINRQDRSSTDSKVAGLAAEVITRRWPLMICQSPIANVSGLILPAATAQCSQALKTLTEIAEDQAKRNNASFLIFGSMRSREIELDGWSKVFTRVDFSNPGTYLNITWSDFEDYLDQLSTKTRKNYRRIQRSAESLNVKVKYNPAVTRLDEAWQLIQSVDRRHHGQPLPWIKDALMHADMVEAIWITAEIDDRLVGCELFIGDGDTRFVTALGIDYAFPNIYFLLGYADIRLAIEKQIKVLRWGNLAYETKARFGFEKDNASHILFLGRWFWLNWIAKRLARLY